MMKSTTSIKAILASAALILAAGTALTTYGQDKDPNLDAIKARQGFMQMVKFNAGPLFGMAKGKVDYDAERAAALANNLILLTNMDTGATWPEGTDNAAYDGKTRALPEIWTTYPKVAEANQAWVDATEALAQVAGNGLEALRSKIGDLGQGCKGCHDDFRAELK